MSYTLRQTIIKGVCLSRADFPDFDKNLEKFIEENRHSHLVGDCAEYFNFERTDVTRDHMLEYFHDYCYLLDSEYMSDRVFFVGEMLFDADTEDFYRDISEYTELTSFNKPIWEFLDKFYPDVPHKTYFVSWTY